MKTLSFVCAALTMMALNLEARAQSSLPSLLIEPASVLEVALRSVQALHPFQLEHAAPSRSTVEERLQRVLHPGDLACCSQLDPATTPAGIEAPAPLPLVAPSVTLVRAPTPTPPSIELGARASPPSRELPATGATPFADTSWYVATIRF